MLVRLRAGDRGRVSVLAGVFFRNGDKLILQALEVAVTVLAAFASSPANGDELGISAGQGLGAPFGARLATAKLRRDHFH